MSVVGIDPGVDGAIVILNNRGRVVDFMDLGYYNTSALDFIKFLKPYRRSEAYLEDVNSYGMGKQSAFNFGKVCGCLKAVCEISLCHINLVKPFHWKEHFGLINPKASPKEKKQASLELARKVFPGFSGNIKLKKHHNRAEAALIALYGLTRGTQC